MERFRVEQVRQGQVAICHVDSLKDAVDTAMYWANQFPMIARVYRDETPCTLSRVVYPPEGV